MIDIDKIEDEIKDIIETNEASNETDFVLSPKDDVLENLPAVQEDPEVIPQTQEADQFSEDFTYIRNNMKDIINQGGETLKYAIAIASQSEHPKSFEVVATLIKALTDANTSLLNTHKTKDERNGVTPQAQTNIQNNTVFVGSTAEFSKMMKSKLNGDK